MNRQRQSSLRKTRGNARSFGARVAAEGGLNHEELSDVVHGQKTYEFPASQDGHRAALALLQPSQSEIDHFGRLGDLESTVHGVRDAGLRAFLRECPKQVSPGQHTHRTSLVHDRKVMLETTEDVFDRLIQRI